ncbi:MAG: ribonuclease D [Candidatus Phaeomarinobacter sp.]
MDIITTTKALEAACATLANETYVTVDTEFLRDSTYWPVLCLIQVAAPKGDALIIDPLADGIDLAAFYALMANTSVIKVFHAARQDIEIFWHEAKTLPDPLFDTQVAAMVCGFGDSVGYENIVKRVTGEQVDKSSRFTDWSRRPLTDKQLRYAAADVTHLRQVYEYLGRRITKSGRAEWVAEEMGILQDADTYEVKPENAWKRLKLRNRNRKAVAVLMEAAAWRESEAQSRNVPRGRILKDDAIQEIATQAPTSADALGNLRAVPRGFAQSRHAKSLLDAVQNGLNKPSGEVMMPEAPEQLPQGLGPTVELLKVLLKYKCEAYDVAQKLICNVADLERIAADDNADVSALRGWRREIFGDDALDLKHGRLCLAIENQMIKPVRLTQDAAE